MTRKTNLMIPLWMFLTDVRKLAYQVSVHADRLSAATQGRIGPGTAKEMERLAELLMRNQSEHHRLPIPSARDLVREASQLVTTIRITARYAGKTNPTILEQLGRVRRGKESRSAAALKFALDMHVSLARQHPQEIEALLPAGTLEDAARVIAGFAAHIDEVKRVRDATAAIGEERSELVAKLRGLVTDVRALAAVLFRGEPTVAERFVGRSPPRSRRQRTRSDVANEADTRGQSKVIKGSASP